MDAEARGALRNKQAEPGWQLAGRVAVEHTSGAGRERQLIRQVVGALRTSAAPGVGWRLRSIRPQRVGDARLPWRWPLRLNAVELATLVAWPGALLASCRCSDSAVAWPLPLRRFLTGGACSE